MDGHRPTSYHDNRTPVTRVHSIIVRPPLLRPPHISVITGGVPGPESRRILPVLGVFSQAGNDFMIHPPPPQISRQRRRQVGAACTGRVLWLLELAACSDGTTSLKLPGGNALDRLRRRRHDTAVDLMESCRQKLCPTTPSTRLSASCSHHSLLASPPPQLVGRLAFSGCTHVLPASSGLGVWRSEASARVCRLH